MDKFTDIKRNDNEAGYRVYQLPGDNKHKNQSPNKISDQHVLKNPSVVLEIGTENIQGLPLLLQKVKENFVGDEHNDEKQSTMPHSNLIPVAKDSIKHFIQTGKNGSLYIDERSIDYCFTENTLYFWDDPLSYLKEIYRVLKSGSIFCMAFIEQKHGGDLPWTQTGFNFYNHEEVKSFFIQAGFVSIEIKEMSAKNTNINGETTNQPFILMNGRK
jgi:SAM-dependent methyltransferase